MAWRQASESWTARRRHYLAAAAAVLYFGLALALLPEYGPTWDPVFGELPYGECLLEYFATGEPVHEEAGHRAALVHRSPHPDFRLAFPFGQTHPFAAVLSALSCRVFWTGLGWLPAMVAHHLPIALLVAALLYVVVVFVGKRLGTLAAVAAPLFLIASPRFFAHGFNNLRDMPEACLYAFAAIAAYVAIVDGRLRWWVVGGVATACALAQKPNALFLPPQMLLFYLLVRLVERGRPDPLRISGRGFAVGSGTFLVAYYAACPALWEAPVEAFRGWLAQVFSFGNVMTSYVGSLEAPDVPWVSWHGPFHVLVTTPPALLALALVGAGAPGVERRLRLFLVVWAVAPVVRVALPGMRDFDGVRHFLEFYPPLAILAGHGLVTLAVAVGRLAPVARGAALPLVFVGALVPSVVATVRTHPNGICYYNALIGELAGARAAGVLDATDYWGNSYWQGLGWLGEHAAEGATVVVPVAPHIVAATAPVRLRPDLRLYRDDSGPITPPLFVMYVTRPGSYGPLLATLDSAMPPVHEIVVQGASVLKVLRIEDPDQVEVAAATLQREARAKTAVGELLAWIQADPAERDRRFAAVWDVLQGVPVLGFEESERRLHALLPARLLEAASDVLWLIANSR